MEQKLTCDVVRDLLPMYVDELTSEATNELVEDHLGECKECSEILEDMRHPMEVETAPEVKDFKKYLKKSRTSIFYWLMGASAVIALVTCFIVNLAVDGTLSWFFIVAMGIATGYLPVYTMLSSSKHRFIKGTAVVNVCTFFMLAVIQFVLYVQMGQGEVWLFSKGFPITVLWSLCMWIAIGSNVLLHFNPVLAVSVLAFLAVPANFLTNWIGGEYEKPTDYFITFVSNGLGNLVAAIILLVIGLIINKRNRSYEARE